MKIKTTQRRTQVARTAIIVAIIIGIIVAAGTIFWLMNSSSSCTATYIRQADKSSSGVQACVD